MLSRRVPRDDYYYSSSTMRENLEFVTINTNFNIIYYNFRFETCNTFFFYFTSSTLLYTQSQEPMTISKIIISYFVCVRFE